jgi:hypothetical protein
MNETIAYTPVKNADRELTVSTIRISRSRYDTVVFDDSADKANVGRVVGGYVIDRSSTWTTSRDEAMDAHREAVYAARVEPITDAPNPA